jgi:hypothetical protein
MYRARLDRRHTLREWQRRQEFDEALEPGRFRKGRTAMGCPRKCEHCRAIKTKPTRQLKLSEARFSEWLKVV